MFNPIRGWFYFLCRFLSTNVQRLRRWGNFGNWRNSSKTEKAKAQRPLISVRLLRPHSRSRNDSFGNWSHEQKTFPNYLSLRANSPRAHERSNLSATGENWSSRYPPQLPNVVEKRAYTPVVLRTSATGFLQALKFSKGAEFSIRLNQNFPQRTESGFRQNSRRQKYGQGGVCA